MRVFSHSASISDWLIELGLQHEFIAISILIIFYVFGKKLNCTNLSSRADDFEGK
jgi:hypothetical protein